MVEASVEIVNKAGLHARAATKLVELIKSYASDVRVGHDKMVDGKSILALMMLGATRGTELKIEVDGPDEDRALAAILALINDRFGEPQ